MKRYIGAIILAAFLQGVSLLLWWPALIVVWAASKVEETRKVFWLAFGGGLLTDLVSQKTLGVTSIYLLLLAFGVGLFKARFEVSLRILLIFLILSQVLWKVVPLPGY